MLAKLRFTSPRRLVAGVLSGVGCSFCLEHVLCAAQERDDKEKWNALPRGKAYDRRAQIEAEHGIVKDRSLSTIRFSTLLTSDHNRRNLWRDDPYTLNPDTLVVAVFGITGGGKSSTCNTMIGSRERLFEQSSTIMSVTKAVSYRDYAYYKRPCRIVDTPGLSDTHRTHAEIAEELNRFTSYAPHGLSAILIVIPHGRFTPEQEAALKDIRALLGPSGTRHSIVVFTHCLNPKNRQQLLRRDELLDEVEQVFYYLFHSRCLKTPALKELPADSTLRLLVQECQHRVVPVENMLEPAKTESRNHLHQRVLDTLAANKNQQYDVSNFLKHTHAASAASRSAGAGESRQQKQHSTQSEIQKIQKILLGSFGAPDSIANLECKAQVFRDAVTGKLHWMLDCMER